MVSRSQNTMFFNRANMKEVGISHGFDSMVGTVCPVELAVIHTSFQVWERENEHMFLLLTSLTLVVQ